LRQNPELDINQVAFTSEEYFVWSRLDGFTSTRQVILMMGFAPDKTIGILRSLRERGAVLVPGETAASVRGRMARATTEPAPHPSTEATAMTTEATEAATAMVTATAAATAVTIDATVAQAGFAAGSGNRPATRPAAGSGNRPAASQPAASGPSPSAIDRDTLDDDERAALDAADIDLDEATRVRILAVRRSLRRTDYFQLLGVDPDVDRRGLKRSYFRLSKEFHPDRFFGKRTGAFGGWLSEIFQSLARAFEVLSDPRRRSEYVAALSGTPVGPGTGAPQTRADYAAELFERACSAEMQGDRPEAIRLFAAALKVDEKPRYLRRAATCAIAAGALAEAETWARRAAELRPDDASIARVVADMLRASKRLDEAEQVLLGAIAMDTDNDVLAGELAADLAAVRQRLGRGA
jgi:hypothetical protein